MTVNLVGPYQPNPSSPRTQGVAFHAPGCDTFLFSSVQPPRMVCLPYQRSLLLAWTVAHNRVQAPLFSGQARPRFDNSFLLEFPGAKLNPGFYDLRVKIKLTESECVVALTTFGWRVEELAIYPSRPKDFESFWHESLHKLDSVPPEPKWTLERTFTGSEIDHYNVTSAKLPENYDPDGNDCDKVEVYRVRFHSAHHKRIEGWYAKPVGAGPYPCLLVLPGAGNIPRPMPIEHARHGYATLDIQVHGNPVDASAFAPLPPEKPNHPDEMTDFGVYLHAVQAARALKLLPGVDANHLAVLGGSQGGRLTIVVAALDSSVKAAIPAITHFAYLPWLRWTERMNQEKNTGEGGYVSPVQNGSDILPESYLDVLNFAPWVRCPVLMNAGLTDPISAPTGIFAVHQALAGNKEIMPLPNTGHDWAPAFDTYAWRWLETTLKKASTR